MGSRCEALGLDPYALGEACAGLLLAANQLRHARPSLTARDYVHPESREGQFLIDLIHGRTDEIVAKYDLERNLARAAQASLSQPKVVPMKQREPGWGRLENKR